jgi:hypothetical protein
MPAPNPYGAILRPLIRSGLPYCVVGSVAVFIYGKPRFTNDIDLVVELSVPDLRKIREAYPGEEYYVPPLETLIDEATREKRGEFNIIHHATGFKGDFFIVRHDPLHTWAMRHRREEDLDGESVWVAPPEYVILRKLEFYREGRSHKHVEDIRGLLECIEVDRRFIDVNLDRMGLHAEWLACQQPAE